MRDYFFLQSLIFVTLEGSTFLVAQLDQELVDPVSLDRSGSGLSGSDGDQPPFRDAIHSDAAYYAQPCSTINFVWQNYECEFPGKGVAHRRSKKKTRFQIVGMLPTMASPNPGSVWPGTDAAVREQQKQDFCQNQDLVPSSP